MKHSRQVLIDGWDQDKVSRSAVLVGGCGATGSLAAEKLARLGVGKIMAADPDVLEEHNLENQAYTRKDLGKKKVFALKDLIREIDSRIKFKSYAKRIEELPEKAFEADYYLSCFDNFAARFYLNDVSVLNNRPVVDAGIQGFTGTVRTIIPNQTACLRCWDSLIPAQLIAASCSKDPIPSTFITASHASDLMVMQLLNLIFGQKAEPFLYFDLKNNLCTSIFLSTNPECVCSGDENGKKRMREVV